MLHASRQEPVESYRWAKAKYNEFERFADIGRVFLQFMAMLALDQVNWSYGQASEPSETDKSNRRKARAIWLRQAILTLGPTFIKVGQFFSTRADLIPGEYIDELAKLQDQVPAFSTELAQEIIEREFGKPVTDLLADFEPIPLASASLGQVHRAKLQTGEAVVVKIQRPGLHQLFTIDLGILGRVARFIQHQTPLGGEQRDWVSIHAECQRTLMLEIDYCNEGKNADRFRRNFATQATVQVPKIYWRYCSPAILTMEYLPGIKITNFSGLEAAGLDRKRVAQLGAQCYLRQILSYGFFHADPHPGNLAVTTQGTLIFYDFGMMGQLPPETIQHLMLTFSGIIQQDATLVVQSMVSLGALSPDSDLGPVRRSVQYMLKTYLAESLEAHTDISMATISDDLYELSHDQPFRFPASFTFVLRSLVALESLGKMLDPEFNLMTAAEPLAQELMPEMEGWSGHIQQQLQALTQTTLDLPQKVNQFLDTVEADDLILRLQLDELDSPLLEGSDRRLGLNFIILGSSFWVAGLELWLAQGWIASGILFTLTGLSAIAWFQSQKPRPKT